MARWGLTAYGGEREFLKYLGRIGNNSSVLFVGAGTVLDFGGIIAEIRQCNSECEITFSDIYDSIEGIGEELVQEGVRFVQMDILQTPDEKSSWDCVVAFGLFSPSVLRREDQEIALENIIKITKDKGFIAISTHERNASNFEKLLENYHSLAYKKMEGYASHVPSKVDFARAWKERNPITHEHYPGFEEYERVIDAYKAYLKTADRRTNYNIIKNLD